MKTITLVAYQRHEYLSKVVESLSRNNLSDFSLIAVVDYSTNPEYRACCGVLASIDFMPRRILMPSEHLGINHANELAYRTALEMGTDLNLALEDDTPISPDCIDMVCWWDNYFRHLRSPRVICCFSHDRNPSDPAEIIRSAFCPWGWSGNRAALELVLNNWMVDERGWDWSIMEYLRKHDIPVCSPRLSRSKNIGRLNGAHYHPALFDEHFSGHISSDGKHRSYRMAV